MAYFDDQGDHCVWAADGQAGIEAFREGCFDLVFLDLTMPRCDGFSVLERLQKDIERVPFIVISASSALDNVVRAMRLGAWDFVSKPITHFELLEHSIERALERVQHQQERLQYQQRLEQALDKKTAALQQELKAHAVAEEENARLQAALYQAQKLEAIGRLAGGVAHDFNNALTSVLGFSELALMDLSKDDRAWGYVQQIQQAGQQAAHLTGQLLAYSRKQVLQLQRLDLNTVIEAMRPRLQQLCSDSVTVQYDLEPNLPALQADPSMLEQIISNVLSNACDAMPSGGGRLTLQPERRYLKGPVAFLWRSATRAKGSAKR